MKRIVATIGGLALLPLVVLLAWMATERETNWHRRSFE